MRRITLTIAAALTAASLTGCGLVAEPLDRHRLQQAWDQTSVEDRDAICTGFILFPDLTAGMVREMSDEADVDPDTAVEFFGDKCAEGLS